ncbi:carboxypeptidase-like regulatory domain-containing protein [Anaeroselena agilis]|uniref:Carboxypeptidase-like regulatory domain-containing protein n=1 Tax=Anaeroselena agilis TaxID=3063788 RepID=A0ABU3P3H1_9FIRM|nr:carboxypeptidase-like regulatory domain-containing protein [Selenomonadales bacterium 4137-cl]
MKRILLGLLVTLLAVALAGCGGGGGGGGGSGTVTANVHCQDETGAALAGVVMSYTDNAGATQRTPASNASGDFVFLITKAGDYPVTNISYDGKDYVVTQGVRFGTGANDIAKSAVKYYRLVINSNGVIQFNLIK